MTENPYDRIEELEAEVVKLTKDRDTIATICIDVQQMLCQDNLIRCNRDCCDCEYNDGAGKVMRKLLYGASLGGKVNGSHN